MSQLATEKIYTWQREGFLISTDISLVDLKALNAALASDEIPWGSDLPDDELKVMVERSVCLGVYTDNETERRMIGFARIITDYVTIGYLTDVYTLPEYGGRGLGSWLINCVKEWWQTMPNGRRLAFVTAEGEHEAFYKRKLGSSRMEDKPDDGGKRYRIVSAPGHGKTV